MKKSLGIRRALVLLAMGGATFAYWGASFGPGSNGCNFANNSDYQDMFEAAGNAVINGVSETYFDFGTDWDDVVRVPTTAFARATWANWLDAHISDDLPNNAVTLR